MLEIIKQGLLLGLNSYQENIFESWVKEGWDNFTIIPLASLGYEGFT